MQQNIKIFVNGKHIAKWLLILLFCLHYCLSEEPPGTNYTIDLLTEDEFIQATSGDFEEELSTFAAASDPDETEVELTTPFPLKPLEILSESQTSNKSLFIKEVNEKGAEEEESQNASIPENTLLQRLGIAANANFGAKVPAYKVSPDSLTPSPVTLVNIDGISVKELDAWRPVWPYAQPSAKPSVIFPTVISSTSPILRPTPLYEVNSPKYFLTKEPVTAYYFDLPSGSNTQAPGPLHDPTDLASSLDSILLSTSPYTKLSDSFASQREPSPSLTPTSTVPRINLPAKSKEQNLPVETNSENPTENSYSLGSLSDFPIISDPKENATITSIDSLDKMGSSVMNNEQGDSIDISSTSTVYNVDTYFSTGVSAQSSFSTLPELIKPSTIINSHSIVPSRVPLWMRISSKSHQSPDVSSKNIFELNTVALASSTALYENDIPLGIFSAELPGVLQSSSLQSSSIEVASDLYPTTLESSKFDVTSQPTLATRPIYTLPTVLNRDYTSSSQVVNNFKSHTPILHKISPPESFPDTEGTVKPVINYLPDTKKKIQISHLSKTHTDSKFTSTPVKEWKPMTIVPLLVENTPESFTDIRTSTTANNGAKTTETSDLSDSTPILVPTELFTVSKSKPATMTPTETPKTSSTVLNNWSPTSSIINISDYETSTETMDFVEPSKSVVSIISNDTLSTIAYEDPNYTNVNSNITDKTVSAVPEDESDISEGQDLENGTLTISPVGIQDAILDKGDSTNEISGSKGQTPSVNDANVTTSSSVKPSTLTTTTSVAPTESSTPTTEAILSIMNTPTKDTTAATMSTALATDPPGAAGQLEPEEQVVAVFENQHDKKPNLHLVQIHANGTNSSSPTPFVRASVSYDSREFCRHQKNIHNFLVESGNKHPRNEKETNVYEVEIFYQPECENLPILENSTDSNANETDVYFYVKKNGRVSANATLGYPSDISTFELSQELKYLREKVTHLELVNAISSEKKLLEDAAIETSILVIIIVTIILVIAIFGAISAVVIIRRRRLAENHHGRRCTPAANDAYSMDSVSVFYHSFKRKNKKRASNKSIKSYHNQGFDDPNAPSRPLNFAKLTHFISDNEGIHKEFSNIPFVHTNYEEMPRGCEDKNRYANVIPVPETRVFLKAGRYSPCEEYINANAIHGPRGEPMYYVATQAPLDETLCDFWQMVWEQESRVIVMLTDFVENGIDKCADYLPPSETLDCHRVYGDFQVTLKSRDMREEYIESHLQLKNLENNLVREIYHMWYTGWPYSGTPNKETHFISFIFNIRAARKKLRSKGPIVVHCSPGTGRSGTFIACDISMKHFDDQKAIDIPKTVYSIRRERDGAVQTKDQYAFIYRVVNLYAAKLTTGNLDSF